MIQNEQELKATLNRIERFEKIVEKLQQVETNPRNYELSAGGFRAEIDRMNLELGEYLSTHRNELIRQSAQSVSSAIICDSELISTKFEEVKPMKSPANQQTHVNSLPKRKVENTQFQRATILDPVFEEHYTVHLGKETTGWRGWIPQLPEVECTAETKKELLNTLAIRLREALQAREDAWDKQLEADIAAGKLEHLRVSQTREVYPRAKTNTS